MRNNTHSKISNEILEACFSLYSDKGWKLLWIARKYDIYHTSLFYHIIKREIVRNVPVLLKKPAEVEAIYKSRLKEIHKKHIRKQDVASALYFEDADEFDISEKTYSQMLKDSLRRKDDKPDTECSHPYWITKCSLCKAILGSDTKVNEIPSNEPVRFVYNEFDKLVCDHKVALELQQMGVYQNSALYWIYYDNRDVLVLRVKTNLPVITDEDAIATSAFTSQELFRLLLRLPLTMRDACFMNKLALNGDNPTYLAKLLVRSLRKFERQRGSKRKTIQETTVCTAEAPEEIKKEEAMI